MKSVDMSGVKSQEEGIVHGEMPGRWYGM